MLKERHFGLDIIRAFAISIVLWQHCNVITSYLPYSLPNVFSKLNLIDGVDLFFVLSGFLIGRILLKTEWTNYTSILAFWKRRLWRTLPNYFLFLIINLILLFINISPGLKSHAVLYYFVFLQNLHKPVDVFFWESWSLCIEEWFYLLFPLTLFLLYKLNKNKNIMFCSSIILFFIFSVSAKYHYIQSTNHVDVDLYLRKLAITRFDTLGFGLLIALVDINFKNIVLKLKWLGLLLFGSYVIFGDMPLKNNLYIIHFLYGALACSGLLIFCYSFSSSNKTLTLLAQFVSKISYSIYLIHLPILYIFNYAVSKDYSNMPLIYLTSYIFTVIGLSALNYKYFESYFLKLRDE